MLTFLYDFKLIGTFVKTHIKQYILLLNLPLVYTRFGAAHRCRIVWHQMVNLAIRKIHIPTISGGKRCQGMQNKKTKLAYT